MTSSLNNKSGYGNNIETYRVCGSCLNCKHLFVMREYEEPDQLFCKRKAPKRPKCGSLFMDEHISIRDEEAEDKWDKWAEPRKVQANGICNYYKDVF